MFNGDKVELPMICDKLRPEETAGLLSHAASYLNAWGTAGEAKAPFIFNDLPVLKPDQFVKFYQSITEGVVA